MAGHKDKKQVIANAREIRQLAILIFTTTLLHISVRILYMSTSVSAFTYITTVLSLSTIWLLFFYLYRTSRPVYQNGKLIDGGPNIRLGFFEYLFDIIYINVFMLLACTLTDYVWYISIVIVLYPAYKLYRMFFP